MLDLTEATNDSNYAGFVEAIAICELSIDHPDEAIAASN